MSQKQLFLLIAIVAAIGVIFLITSKKGTDSDQSVLEEYTEVQAFAAATTLSEPLTINDGESAVLEGGAILTTEEVVVIDGALGCRNGSLTLVAKASLTINGVVACEDGGDLTIVANGGLTMSESAQVVSDGNIQIVDGEAVVRSEEELDQLYDQIETVPEEGIAVGPFVEDLSASGDGQAGDEEVSAGEEATAFISNDSWLTQFIPTAHAQIQNGTTTVNLTGEPIVVSGKIKVGTPRKGAKRVVVFDFPNTPEVTIHNFELEGPAGRTGEPDTGSCDVTGKPGEDAFRFNAFAPNLKVNNFTLTLGDGGEGGQATTGDGCGEAKAKGGKGGKPGNFRMIGSQNFEIVGAFTIHPGRGGDGGGATAMGKDGDPGEKGGDARATAGNGANNKKKLTVMGTVAGTNNVQFGDAVGGNGGFAVAFGGHGGDADTCGQAGGSGGKATARSGDGGDAKLTVTGGAGRMEVANDIGGNGGLLEVTGGDGGTGGSCEEQSPGGNGGVGGAASATEGKGGFGKSGRADDGAILDETGGNGGYGGDGCTEGKGGAGGSGDPDGEDGKDGQNTCITITKEEDFVSLLPGEIQVIKYMDYDIPIANDNLKIAGAEEGCDGDHYHVGPGGAINTMGYPTPDPNPTGCGFGKVSETEIHIIRDPNYVDPNTEDSGGQMIQIEPPKLIIPAR